jgi:hypothetical protein
MAFRLITETYARYSVHKSPGSRSRGDSDQAARPDSGLREPD